MTPEAQVDGAEAVLRIRAEIDRADRFRSAWATRAHLLAEAGRFDWSMPDAEVHAFVNELERDIGTYLFGRRMSCSCHPCSWAAAPGFPRPASDRASSIGTAL